MPSAVPILAPILADWFAAKGWAPRRHQLAMLDAASEGRAALLVGADGGRQDARRLPAKPRRAGARAREGAAHALRFAAEGAGGRRTAQPARSGRGDGARHPHRDPHRRYAFRPQGAAAGQAAKPAADHARVAQPAAVLSRVGPALRGAQDHRDRRGPRLRDHQARRPAVAVHGAAPTARACDAPRRALGDRRGPGQLSRLGCRPTATSMRSR